MRIKYEVVIGGILKSAEALKVKTDEKRIQILKNFGRYMKKTTDKTIEKLAHGGTYRGITWDKFEIQYKRDDGTEIPAWGGVKQVKGRKNVKPQRRGPFKTHVVKPDSKLLQSRGKLKTHAAAHHIIDSDGRTMRINSGGKGSKYFARQQSIRPYITLTGEDLAEFRRHVLKTYKVFR